jgi:hypothetical protein
MDRFRLVDDRDEHVSSRDRYRFSRVPSTISQSVCDIVASTIVRSHAGSPTASSVANYAYGDDDENDGDDVIRCIATTERDTVLVQIDASEFAYALFGRRVNSLDLSMQIDDVFKHASYNFDKVEYVVLHKGIRYRAKEIRIKRTIRKYVNCFTIDSLMFTFGPTHAAICSRIYESLEIDIFGNMKLGERSTIITTTMRSAIVTNTLFSMVAMDMGLDDERAPSRDFCCTNWRMYVNKIGKFSSYIATNNLKLMRGITRYAIGYEIAMRLHVHLDLAYASGHRVNRVIRMYELTSRMKM